MGHRVVVVSGGGTGIGRAVALAFARDGDDVVILGRRADVLTVAAEQIRRLSISDSTKGAGVTPIVADLSEPAEVQRAADTLAERYPEVDVLVNNAGGNAGRRPPDPAPTGLAQVAWHWEANFRSNVLTAALLTEALADRLADRGRVILLSSIAALRGSGDGSYGGAKAALHPYAMDLARRLGPRGITVNVVAPGYTADTEFFAGGVSESRHQHLVQQTLTGRAGTPEDVAALVHWLARPASGHVTAQILQVNGGALAGR